MTESGIGRVLVASLHQGIADILPARLDYYEHWLSPEGLRHGTIGLAPLTAVLSFLRLEGPAYQVITRRAGEYAAEWIVASQRSFGRPVVRRLPARLRARLVARSAGRAIRKTSGASRAAVRLRHGCGTVEVRGSLFCRTTNTSAQPMCGFYAGLTERFFGLYGLAAEVETSECRAAGHEVCILTVDLAGGRRAEEPS